MGWNFTPKNPVTALANINLTTMDQALVTWVGCDASVWHISGGLAPVMGAQEGVSMYEIKGLMAPIKHIGKQGARQDGEDWDDAVYEPGEIDITIDVGGLTASGYRRVQRNWLNSWDARRPGRLHWYTSGLGEWWLDLRLAKELTDTLHNAPAMALLQRFVWSGRYSNPFWQSFDAVCQLNATNSTTLVDAAGLTHNNFATLSNRGDQDGWPRYLIQGPGTFTLGDNGGPATITLGPLTAGQTVLITTMPRIRSVIELTTQTNLYPLMSGRFSTPIPATATLLAGLPPQNTVIPISGTGMTAGVSAVTASLTPQRKWPD